MPHQTPEDKARAQLHAQVTAAAAAAHGAALHPAHWQLHHIALTGAPGNFTPYPAPQYAEEELSPFGELLERLTEMLGPDHARTIARRGLEVAQ
jgi:hypothetical protein